jgi:hypothetical protein
LVNFDVGKVENNASAQKAESIWKFKIRQSTPRCTNTWDRGDQIGIRQLFNLGHFLNYRNWPIFRATFFTVKVMYWFGRKKCWVALLAISSQTGHPARGESYGSLIEVIFDNIFANNFGRSSKGNILF